MKNSPLTIFFAAALLLCACKKELNVYPTTSEADGNLITDQVTAQQVLNGVYYQFAAAAADNNNSGLTAWCDVNEAIPSELSGLLQLSYGGGELFTHTYAADDYFISGFWIYNYTLADAANRFIGNMTPVTSVTPAAKQQMLAEATFLRAFANEQLLFYFGQYTDTTSQYGIILRNEPVSASNINSPRSSVAATYASILADLDAAIAGLPVLNSAIYYVNASTAKLLKARVLMNRGAAGDYAQVISLTNDIITNGPFVLEDSLKDIFLTKGFNSKEVMLGIQPYPNDYEKFDAYTSSPSFISAALLPALTADDARSQWVYQHYDVQYSGNYNELTKYFSGDILDPAETPLCTNGFAFRLSEAYLLQAEALTMSGGDTTTAKVLLKTVMNHAGAGPTELAAVDSAATPAALQLEIVKENMRNFAYENGVDWYALRRLPFATIQTLNPNIKTQNLLILPIPASELSYNKVVQNPGY